MFEKFKKYWDTLDIYQKNALYSSYSRSFIYKNSSYDRDEEPKLRFPKTFATLDPANYKAEISLIDEDSDYSLDKMMYLFNYMVKNTNLIDEETYKTEIEKYIKEIRTLDLNALSKIFCEEQFLTVLKTLCLTAATSNNLREMDFVRLELLLSDNPSEYDFTKTDLSEKYLFYTQKQLKAAVIDNPDSFRNIKNCLLKYVDNDVARKYADRYQSLIDNLYAYKTDEEKIFRDKMIIQLYKHESLEKFVQQVMSIDIQFGKLLVPLLQAGSYTEYGIKIKVNDIVNKDKCFEPDYSDCKEKEFLGRELSDMEKHDYRYPKIIRQMLYLARCCTLKAIPKSKQSFVGNGLCMLQLFNYDWNRVWDNMYGHLTNDDI